MAVDTIRDYSTEAAQLGLHQRSALDDNEAVTMSRLIRSISARDMLNWAKTAGTLELEPSLVLMDGAHGQAQPREGRDASDIDFRSGSETECAILREMDAEFHKRAPAASNWIREEENGGLGGRVADTRDIQLEAE